MRDLVTGLIWQKTPDFVKRTQDDAEAYADQLNLAGRDDWCLPSVMVEYGGKRFLVDMGER